MLFCKFGISIISKSTIGIFNVVFQMKSLNNFVSSECSLNINIYGCYLSCLNCNEKSQENEHQCIQRASDSTFNTDVSNYCSCINGYR